MKPDNTTSLQQKIKRLIRHIILKYAFIDSIERDMSEKLSNMVTFGRDDLVSILYDIGHMFNMNINKTTIDNSESILDMTINEIYNLDTKSTKTISDITVIEICNIVFDWVNADPQLKQKILTERNSSTGPTLKLTQPANPDDSNVTQPKQPTWTRDKIFSYIIKALTKTIDYTVTPKDVLWDLMEEMKLVTGGVDRLYTTIHHLEYKFNIKIDLSQTVAQIGNNAEISLINTGDAVDSRIPPKSYNKYWYFILTTCNLNWLCSWINQSIGINLAPLQVKRTPTFQAFVKLVEQAIARKNARIQEQQGK